MSLQLDGTNGATFNDGSLQAAAASPYVLKNRIINGAMVIDQRNAGASVTANDGTFVVDRFKYVMSQNSKGTSQQSTTAPSNFTNSILFTSSSAYTVGASEYFLLTHIIEGYNIADLGWGTASAQSVTLSFQVRSSLTGTFGGALENGTRFYPFSYTISAANTWETKTITIAGDTSGTWNTTNGSGIRIRFSLGAGSTVSGTAGSWGGTTYYSATGATSVVGTNGATFYITALQLEVGTSATPFEQRLYNQELANCQRYFEHNYGTGYAIGSAKAYPYNVGCEVNGFTTTSGQKWYSVPYKVTKRAIPTISFYDANGNLGKITTLDLGGTPTHNVNIGVTFVNDTFVGLGASNGTHSGVTWFFASSAEL